MGGKLRDRLATQLGRNPTEAEVLQAKLAKLQARDTVVWQLQLAERTCNPAVGRNAKLGLCEGLGTRRPIRINYQSGKVTTTVTDIRNSVRKGLAVCADNGLQLFVGENLTNMSSLHFISDEDAWQETFALQVLEGNTAPVRTIFVVEVLPSNEASLGMPKPSCTPRPNGVSISTTPIELEQALSRASSSTAKNPRGSGSVPARSRSQREVEDSDEDSNDDSEEEQVGKARDCVTHMVQQLTNLVKLSKKPELLQSNGKPQFVLTDGKVNKDKSYVPVRPMHTRAHVSLLTSLTTASGLCSPPQSK